MADGVSITATQVVTGLDQPTFVLAAPGHDDLLLVGEKTGHVRVVDEASHQVRSQPLLDLSAQVSTESERGLLGFAVDPDFAHNGRVFVDFTDRAGNTEIRSYHVDQATLVADPASATQVLSIHQPPFANHKGGWLAFGRDGALYVATGDGGSEGDPLGNGQNPHSLLGKILRLNVNHDDFPLDAQKNYAIPHDNPFVGDNAAPEIWALGLRNPWRNSFDPATGRLFIADVGQDHWEEINQGKAGANYQWNVKEGPATFHGGSYSIGSPTDPVFSYPHAPGAGNAVIGGLVYHGPGNALQGDYFFADNGTGQVWTMHLAGGEPTVTERTGEITSGGGHIAHPTSFGTDAHGALLLADLDGAIWQLTPHATAIL